MTVHHERLLRDQVADLSLGLAMVDRTFYKPLVKPMAARLLGGPYDPVNNISSKWSDFLQVNLICRLIVQTFLETDS